MIKTIIRYECAVVLNKSSPSVID